MIFIKYHKTKTTRAQNTRYSCLVRLSPQYNVFGRQDQENKLWINCGFIYLAETTIASLTLAKLGTFILNAST